MLVILRLPRQLIIKESRKILICLHKLLAQSLESIYATDVCWVLSRRPDTAQDSADTKLSETEMCPLPTVLDIRERPEGDPVWADGFPRAGQLPAGCRYPLRSGLIEAVWSQAKQNTPPGIGEDKPVFCSWVTRSLLHLSPEPSCEGGFITPTLSIQGTRDPKRRGHLFKVTRPAGGGAKFQSQVCLTSLCPLLPRGAF